MKIVEQLPQLRMQTLIGNEREKNDVSSEDCRFYIATGEVNSSLRPKSLLALEGEQNVAMISTS